MTTSIPEIVDLVRRNELILAQQLCQELVARAPSDANSQHLLGMIYFKFGNLELSIRHLQEAIRLDPNNAEAYNNLASIYYKQGSIALAIPLYERSIRRYPGSWEAHYNLGNCYIKKDMVLQAIEQYQAVLELQPQHINTKLNLAMALVSINDYATALPLLVETAALEPQNGELQGHLATAYLELGKSEQALQQYQIALELYPNRAEWHHNLAVLYLRAQQLEAAKRHFIRSIDLDPNNSIAKHMLEALNATPATNAPPQEYVASLFDQYAGYYNKHVTTALQYKVPQLLRNAMSKFITATSPQRYVLDLGCGTGLCGIYFRDLARVLIGIDLSLSMLAQAKTLSGYDGLCCGNILETIPGLNQQCFDLIIAADVFVYIGDLDLIFTMINSALQQNGQLAFTIEEQNINNTFTLQNTGRYSHSIQYINDLAAKHGFIIETNESIVPRLQNESPIDGRLYIMRKFNDSTSS
jgi:predicted TPR repeat methyltransferase